MTKTKHFFFKYGFLLRKNLRIWKNLTWFEMVRMIWFLEPAFAPFPRASKKYYSL